MTTTKKCSKCKQDKPLSEFRKNNIKKDGLQYHCKQCDLQYNKRYYQAHKVEIKQYQKQYSKKYYQTLRGHLQSVWQNMFRRCGNPKYKQFKDWGGRGIEVKFACFDDFFDYVVNILKAEPRGLTIDRINNDGNYERDNIRFVTQAENNRNKRVKCDKR